MADVLTRLLLNTSDFDAKLGKARKEVKESEDSFVSLGKGAAAGFAKIAGAVGIAYGGMETFNKIISSSQTLADGWDKVCRSAKSSVDEFFYALSSGDVTAFSMGLDEIINKAREAAGALDQLGNSQMSYDFVSAENQAKFTKAMAAARDKTLSKGERAKALEEAKTLAASQADIATRYRTDAMSAIRAVASEGTTLNTSSISDEDLKYFFSLDIMPNRDKVKEQLKSAYEEYRKEVGKVSSENRNRPDGNTAMLDQLKMLDKLSEQTSEQKANESAGIATLNERYKMAILYNKILEKWSDDELRGQGQLYRAGWNAEQTAATMSGSLNKAKASIYGIPKSGKTEFNVDTAPTKRSIAEVDAKLKELNKEFANAPTYEVRVKIYEEIKEWTDTRANMVADAGLGDRARASAKKLAIKLPDVKKGGAADEIRERAAAYEGLSTSIGKVSMNADTACSAMSAVGQVLSNSAALTGEGAAQWLSWGANMLNAVGIAIPAITALIAAKKAEANANAAAAVTGAASSTAAIPIIGPIMAVAAIASVVAALASVPKFAEGGIVGGSSYFGDKVLAAVNSGEMILNTNQQRNLAGLVEPRSSNVNVAGTFRMRGRDMYAVIKQEERFEGR